MMHLKLNYKLSLLIFLVLFVACEIFEQEEDPEQEEKTITTINGEQFEPGSVSVFKYDTKFYVELSEASNNFLYLNTNDTIGGAYQIDKNYLQNTNLSSELIRVKNSYKWEGISGSLKIEKSEEGTISGKYDAIAVSTMDSSSLEIKNGYFEVTRSEIIDYTIDRKVLFNDSLNYGSLSDIDGNVYKTIKIGKQEWMAENLRVTNFNDGEELFYAQEDKTWVNNYLNYLYCWAGGDSIHKYNYGALYSWVCVGRDKLCPSGWHVPGNEEWDEFFSYLENNGYGHNNQNEKIGKALAANQGWKNEESDGTVGNNQFDNNSSGFSAIPAGYRDRALGVGGLTANFTSHRIGAFWWTATEKEHGTAYIKQLYSNGFAPTTMAHYMTKGMAVRCVKDLAQE